MRDSSCRQCWFLIVARHPCSCPGRDQTPEPSGLVPDYCMALLAAGRASEEVDYFDLDDTNRLEFDALTAASDAAQMRFLDFVQAHAAALIEAFAAALARTHLDSQDQPALSAHGRTARTPGLQRIPIQKLKWRRFRRRGADAED